MIGLVLCYSHHGNRDGRKCPETFAIKEEPAGFSFFVESQLHTKWVERCAASAAFFFLSLHHGNYFGRDCGFFRSS